VALQTLSGATPTGNVCEITWRRPDANKIPTGGKDDAGNGIARQMIAFNDRTRLTGQLTDFPNSQLRILHS